MTMPRVVCTSLIISSAPIAPSPISPSPHFSISQSTVPTENQPAKVHTHHHLGFHHHTLPPPPLHSFGSSGDGAPRTPTGLPRGTDVFLWLPFTHGYWQAFSRSATSSDGREIGVDEADGSLHMRLQEGRAKAGAEEDGTGPSIGVVALDPSPRVRADRQRTERTTAFIFGGLCPEA